MNRFKRSLAAIALCGASAAAGLVGSSLVQNVKYARAAEEVEATRSQLATVNDLASVFKAVGKVVEPSVVQIQVRKSIPGARSLPFDDDMLRRFFPDKDGDGQPDIPEGFGGPGGGEQVGTGSGVIMEASDGVGYILTNNHVAGGATEMDITLADGREFKTGKLVGTDKKTDLAVVKIEADHLIPAKWGNSDTLDRGDWVLAFGSPFGYVGSMTHGIVSALNREAQIIEQGYENFIQVDAPINPGNSGGPLVNLHGEVVGINTAIASRSGGFQGIGFAIPSNQAHFVYNAIKSKGKVTRGWLGVKISDVAKQPEIANSFGYTSRDGVLIDQTYPDTPADGKLKSGDIITKIDGKSVTNVQQLRNQVAIIQPGQETHFTVFRDGKDQDVAIKIGEQPEDLVAAARNSGHPGRGHAEGNNNEGSGSTMDSIGVKLGNPSPELLKRFRMEEDVKGAVVTQVEPRSDAAAAGLRQGDVITKVGNTDVTNADEARDALKGADLKKGARLYVTNADGSRFVILKNR
jgi:serine protease Do